MKFFIIFFLLFSVSYGYSQTSESEVISSESLSSREALLVLRKQLNRYVDTLIYVLLDKDTPRENQVEILGEVRTIADINGKITLALNEMSQSDIGQNEINISKDIGRDEDISVWVKNQVELIRRKQLVLNELERGEKELDEDFWVNLALDGVVIVAGGVLFFVPAVGPAISIPLTVGRITHVTVTGQRLGALLMATGAAKSGLGLWSYFFGEEKKVPSFLSDIAFRDVLTRELFSILSSANPSDRYLAINLLKSTAVGEEALISDLLNAIQDKHHSSGVKQSAIRALRAISGIGEELKEKVIAVLIGVIDESKIPVLRQTAISYLGELGEGGDKEVAEYLLKKGNETDKEDESRLIALIELGRDKDDFPVSINKLDIWLEGRDYGSNPLKIQPEISDSFLDSLLLANQGERSKSHFIVVREFIRSGILNAELKLRFSETLLSWDASLENKSLLREAYSNTARDIGLYVEKDLFKGGLFEENYEAFHFLINQISKLETIDNVSIVLKKMESIIKEFKILHSNQSEIAEELEEVVNSYKKILETIKK